MTALTRLPALPLVANDPYFSIWSPYDRLTDGDTAHWAGEKKPLRGTVTVDGTAYRFLGAGDAPAMETVEQTESCTATKAVFAGAGIRLTLTFRTPALPIDPELLSTPVTFVSFEAESADGKKHAVKVDFTASARLCYDGDAVPEMVWGEYPIGAMHGAYLGQRQQKLLCHSGDHITIDWGYLYMASSQAVTVSPEGIAFVWEAEAANTPVEAHLQLGYDDVASILYFGTPCKAWYARNGKTLPQAMASLEVQYKHLVARCEALDKSVAEEADRIGGEDYRLIVNAAWRHTFAAHKLIATPKGEMALLSKENDSNGCIGTVDVAYPASPIFLRFCPELCEALCRPVLEFANMAVWEFDFAPHDVGRYPIVGGQVYAYKDRKGFGKNGSVYPPLWQYPAGCDVYEFRNQMPVEECGNMLIMLCVAARRRGDYSLIRQYRGTLDKWVKYLIDYGEDPGEQLCTDDFAGHLARNINLSAKAMVGVACWGHALEAMHEDGSALIAKAKAMAESWYARARTDEATALTFDGIGWSMKYNTVWDRILGLDLLPEEFYERETKSYLPRMNRFGLPLDSRADYTKSDWLVWSASLSPDNETFRRLIAPLAAFLRESESRLAFSDWYFTSTGLYRSFIGRPVQGGLFLPFLLPEYDV